MENYLTIVMCVKRTSKPECEYIEFTPEEYFDIDEDEPLDVDSVPKHLEYIDYLSESEDVFYISVRINNLQNGRETFTETNFFDNQKSRLVLATDYLNKEEVYKLIITSMKVPTYGENSVESLNICRFEKNKGEDYRCVLANIVSKQPDGSEEVYDIDI